MKQLFISFLITVLMVTGFQGLKADSPQTPLIEKRSYFVFSPDGKYLVKVFFSGRDTWVRIHETQEMKTVTQWQIPNFQAHTVRFSLKDPRKLLLADKQRLLVYRLIDGNQKLLFFQPKIQGQEIVQAYFNQENDELVWATKQMVYKAGNDETPQEEILSVPWEDGEINAVASLGDHDYAVQLKGSKTILLVSPENRQSPSTLNGHDSPLVGIQSDKKEQLYSLDENYHLVIWNVSTKQPRLQLDLKKPSEDAKLLGFTLDDEQKKLQLLSEENGDYHGQGYALKQLENGELEPEDLPMTITSAGNVYKAETRFSENKEIDGDEGKTLSVPSETAALQAPRKKQNTLYDLAKIEAENGSYQASLDLIKRIPLDDPQFGESRELKRRVFDAINVQNTVSAARDQINRGNYKSAKIILENALAKTPENETLIRHLQQVDDKLSDNFWVKFLVVIALLLLLVLLIYLIWRYQAIIIKRTGPKPQSAGKLFGFGGMKRPKPDENRDLRRQFVYRLDEIRRLLNKAAINDTDRRYKNTWMELTARLNTMEKRARLNDSFLSDFIAELLTIQQTIEKLLSQNAKKKGFQFEEDEKVRDNHQQKQNETNRSTQSEETEQSDSRPDYHAILGVRKNASLEEIKQAYRQKMKDYHPDRHNASDFTWVKEEADRRTKLVQEAYIRLSEQQKSI